MFRRSIFTVLALLLSAWSAWGCDTVPGSPGRNLEIGYLDVGSDITLRRMVVHNSAPVGTVLFLHGFPETLCVWRDIALALSSDYEVHAIDWPGYGFSSRPPAEAFSYAPRDYAWVLHDYIDKAGIDRSKLTIYATDIGALPALLAALDDPGIARQIIVGDFAPFDRPQYMYETLQSLKSEPSATKIHAYMNKTDDEILANAFTRGLPESARFDVPADIRDEMVRGWRNGKLTSADAFYLYYSHFTRDQDFFEENLGKLKTPVRVIWGDGDIYINKAMGAEFAKRINADLVILPGTGHYPHLQHPEHVIAEFGGLSR